MTVTERVAYIKGLYEGLGFNPESKEAKVLLAILDAMQDMALSIADLEEENGALEEVIDTLLEDLYDEDESYDEDEDEDDGLESLDLDSDTELYQVICPSCGEEIYVDEQTLEQGNVSCPACGEDLEFDLSALELQQEGEAEAFDEEPDDMPEPLEVDDADAELND